MVDENVQYIAIFLIGAKDPRREFLTRAQDLINKGKISRDDLPKILEKLCKMKGNAGEIGREIREEIKRVGWAL